MPNLSTLTFPIAACYGLMTWPTPDLLAALENVERCVRWPEMACSTRKNCSWGQDRPLCYRLATC
eukprot:10999405-Karenia_brevis.AAC.1